MKPKQKSSLFFNNSESNYKQNCSFHFLGTILCNLGPGSCCYTPCKNLSPANQHPVRNNELQGDTHRWRGGGLYLPLIFSEYLSSWSLLKSIWPMPPIFNNSEIHGEVCCAVSRWVMKRGKVKCDFRVSVWQLIAIYQQHEQQEPGPISASWCSETNV